MNYPGEHRYQRQIILPGFGESGQQKLYSARVLVAGAGGLGCPVLQYLAGAGIGRIGIADFDTVSLSNLHRQVLFSTDDVGLDKATRAAEILSLLNPDIEVIAHRILISSDNIDQLIRDYDIVVDGTDNFSTRYLINDACYLSGKTLVYGAVSRFDGQIAVFNHLQTDGSRSTNYRDLFPVAPNASSIPNCEEAGVLGVLPAIIGSMMANEVIKLVSGLGQASINRLITFNALNNSLYEIGITPRPEGRKLIPADFNSLKSTDYQALCGESGFGAVSPEELWQKVQSSTPAIIDVRESDLSVRPADLHFRHIPLHDIKDKFQELAEAEALIFFCHSGRTSAQAARIAVDYFGKSIPVYHLKGGVAAWNHFKSQHHEREENQKYL